MKKLIALLLALVMVLALAACAAKMEPAKTETTDTKTEQTTTEETKTEDPAPAEETTGEKMYIPVMAKGFQHPRNPWRLPARTDAGSPSP